MGYLDRFFLYLLALGYSTAGYISEENTTISNYENAIDTIAKLEGWPSAEDFVNSFKDLESLTKSVAKLKDEYTDSANPKSKLISSKEHTRTISGLSRFSEFLEHCNKRNK